MTGKLRERGMPVHRALLEHRPVFHSHDVDETRAFLDPFGLRFDPIGSSTSPLDVRLNGVFLPNIYIGYVQYGAPALIRMDPEASYSIKLPTRGRLEAESHKDVVSCDTRRGVVLSPTRKHRLRSETGGARLNIALKRDPLVRQLTALLGTGLNMPLEFAAALNLREGHGRSLSRFARLAVGELERADSLLSNAIMISAFEQFLMTGLLLRQPHNYTEALQRRDRPIATRDVKRAIDYMEANLDTPIGLPEIATVSGVPGRTLLKHFRDFEGTSPMRYLRAARYEKVRETLCRAQPEEGVTEIAAKWGFGHMGRFSIDYRKRFGERPSETLRRSRVTMRAQTERRPGGKTGSPRGAR